MPRNDKRKLVEAFSEMSLDVRPSEVKKAQDRKDELELFLGGISTECSESDVKEFFNERYVRVASLKVLRRNCVFLYFSQRGKANHHRIPPVS